MLRQTGLNKFHGPFQAFSTLLKRNSFFTRPRSQTKLSRFLLNDLTMDTKVTKFFISTLLLSAGIIVGVEAQSAGTVHGLDGSSYDPTTGSPPYGLYCNADSGPPPAQLDGLVAAYGNHGSGECNLYATDGQALEYSPDNSTAPSIVCGLVRTVPVVTQIPGVSSLPSPPWS